MGEIAISVLLPLQEQRETGRACVEAWTRSQTLARDRYEVVALAPGIDPDLERDVRPLLAPHDRWIEHPTDSEYVLFNLGAREAQGRFLFCTEAHCVPEPDCLEAMLDELGRTGAPGARGRSVGIAHGPLGRLEMDEYERALRVEEEPDHWRKVLIHSLAIRRDVYLEAGGFPPRYGDFSPWALAIALRENGHRLIYSPRPAVRHSYTGELGELIRHVREFGRCEMRYCADVPRQVRGRYLEETDEWTERGSYTRSRAWHALRAGLAARRRDLAPELARHAAVAVAGPRAEIVAGHAAVGLRMIRVIATRDGPGRVRAYRRLWQAASRLGRLEGVAELEGPPPPPVPVDGPPDLELTGDGAKHVVGLHPVEAIDGVEFRWTHPLLLARTGLQGGGTLDGRLELVGLRDPYAAGIKVVVDGRVLPGSNIRVEADAVSFQAPATRARWVGMACEPHKSPHDRRRLGLPVRSLSLRLS